MKILLTLFTISTLAVFTGCQSNQVPGYSTNKIDTNNSTSEVMEETADTAITGVDIYSEENKADWKTYTNEEYGFNFRYPDSFTMYPPFKGIADLAEETSLGIILC